MAEFCNVGKTARVLSTIGGAGLMFSGIRRSHQEWTVLGAALLLRGLVGWCPFNALAATPHAKNASLDGTYAVRLKRGCTVNVAPSAAYSYLSDLHNLSRFCAAVGKVERDAESGSRWRIFDGDGALSCTVEIINDVPNERLAWRTLPGAGIAHAGTIRLEPGPAANGTEVTATVSFAPRLMHRLANRVAPDTTSLLLTEVVRRFKQLMEAGELAIGPPSYKSAAKREAART